jgi:hypothetical protein
MQPPTICIAKTKQDHNIAAERFKRELEILCSLASSPHVVPVIGVCFTEREIILLMQVLAVRKGEKERGEEGRRRQQSQLR